MHFLQIMTRTLKNLILRFWFRRWNSRQCSLQEQPQLAVNLLGLVSKSLTSCQVHVQLAPGPPCGRTRQPRPAAPPRQRDSSVHACLQPRGPPAWRDRNSNAFLAFVQASDREERSPPRRRPRQSPPASTGLWYRSLYASAPPAGRSRATPSCPSRRRTCPCPRQCGRRPQAQLGA
jgi:hypothetical protein